MKIAPCKDCPYRSEKCHGKCNAYLTWLKERTAISKRMQETNLIRYGMLNGSVKYMRWKDKKRKGQSHEY